MCGVTCRAVDGPSSNNAWLDRSALPRAGLTMSMALARPTREHWLGLEKIHCLTASKGRAELYVDMCDCRTTLRLCVLLLLVPKMVLILCNLCCCSFLVDPICICTHTNEHVLQLAHCGGCCMWCRVIVCSVPCLCACSRCALTVMCVCVCSV